jgi:hypothetical protein
MPYLASWRHRRCSTIKAMPRQSFVIHPNSGWWQSTLITDNRPLGYIGIICLVVCIVYPVDAFRGWYSQCFTDLEPAPSSRALEDCQKTDGQGMDGWRMDDINEWTGWKTVDLIRLGWCHSLQYIAGLPQWLQCCGMMMMTMMMIWDTLHNTTTFAIDSFSFVFPDQLCASTDRQQNMTQCAASHLSWVEGPILNLNI